MFYCFKYNMFVQVLNGIKVLKLYSWETSFSYHLITIRREDILYLHLLTSQLFYKLYNRDSEIKSLKNAAYMNAFTSFLWTCAPFLVALASFATYVLIDENNVLDPSTAFVSITYFNMLRIPLNMLPNLVVNKSAKKIYHMSFLLSSGFSHPMQCLP